jgi:hypothetical protein
MGSTFTQGATRADIIREVNDGWTCRDTEGREVGKVRTIIHCLRGNILWSVMEKTFDLPDEVREPERWINCAVLMSDKGYGWGYKAMTESMGPCYYSCPIKYLDMVETDAGPYAAAWREKVREYAAKVQSCARLKVGSQVRLKKGINPNRLTITAIGKGKQRSHLFAKSETGHPYHLPRRFVDEVIA